MEFDGSIDVPTMLRQRSIEFRVSIAQLYGLAPMSQRT